MTSKLNTIGLRLVMALRSPWREDGQTLVEYVLILSFVALAVLGAVLFIPNALNGFFSTVGSDI
jgi:Flp pilus assembly pilin Flp